MSSKAGGLLAIARALNEGDIARAQIATVLLAIPEPPALSKDMRSREDSIKFIRELYRRDLIKWDADEHPRRPTGAPDSQGGQFAPKGDGAQIASCDGSAGHDDSHADEVATVPRPQSAVYYETEDNKFDPNPIPVVAPFMLGRDQRPETTLIWSEPIHAASHDPDATPDEIREAIQHQFASKRGGEYWIDPETYEFDSAIDVGQQIDDSINNPGGYMRGILKEALKTDGPVGFNTHDWHSDTKAMRFQNSLWAGDTVGRVAGKIEDGVLNVGTDGNYNATGTIVLEHTGPYDWTPDGEDELKNAIIVYVGNQPYINDGHVQAFKDGVPIFLKFTRTVRFIVRGRYHSLRSY
jgi:hypothetical protein